MARPRSAHRTFGRRQARLTDWIGPAIQGSVNVASGGASIISSASFDAPATIVRTRGNVAVIPQSFAADLNVFGAIGVGIVSDEAFNAGVASIPEPFADADWSGWYLWRSFSYTLELGDATSIMTVNWNFEVDSRAMRKVGSNETLVVVAESQGGAFSLFAGVRTLVKLP